MCVCVFRQGQLQDSVEAFSHAMQLSPFFLDAYVGRGNAYMDYGHAHAIKQAQRDFLSALHLDPLCSTARINLAYNLQVSADLHSVGWMCDWPWVILMQAYRNSYLRRIPVL